jgi:hypothetical protein
MVVEIELTLCSIIQGVALYFLVDNARLILSGGQSAAWPYVTTGGGYKESGFGREGRRHGLLPYLTRS